MTKLQTCHALHQVEVRLFDCVDILEETRRAYFEPDLFRRNLNNLIQATRNVTWILQNNKSKFEDFDAWYGGWQTEMRKDDVLRWLNEARVEIVKRGDLETNSVFQITLKESWLSNPKFEAKVDPFIGSEEWVENFAKRMPADMPLTVGLLRAERKWVDSKFPKEEILKNISHALVVISRLVRDAHSHLKDSEKDGACLWGVQENFKEAIDCVLNDWGRVVWYDLSAKGMLDVKLVETKRDANFSKEKVLGHYPGLAKIGRGKAEGFRGEIKKLFEYAKVMLAKDKGLLSVAFIKRSDNTGLMLPLSFENRAQKHLSFEALANVVRQEKGTSVMIVGKMWFAKADKPFKLTPTGIESENKRELFKVHGILNTGETYSLGQFFSRDAKGDIVFEEVFENEDEDANFLKPIRDVWGLP